MNCDGQRIRDSVRVPAIEQWRPQPAPVILFTGLSGSGKTTLCRAVADFLIERFSLVSVLDGDDLRQTLCADLGFSREDRKENLRRIGVVARDLAESDSIVLIAAIAPYSASRWELRRTMTRFVEIYVNAPLETCMDRDPKGLYRRALAGELVLFTGVDDEYEPPDAPEIECNTDRETVAESVAKIVTALTPLLNHPAQTAVVNHD